MSAPEIIKQMVATFAANLDAYKSGAFNEAQARIQFINPMLTALGWDVSNRAGYAEAYKDVIHEDSLRIGSAVKAPDYCCRIGGTRKFFIEAKKPSVNIKEDIHPAYQLRRYAWSAKLPLSVLTDFEEFAVYDCRIKPVKTDKASTARVMYIRFEEYPERWQEIADIFSREAILKGSFDKYAASHKKKRGTASVDAAFLSEIEQWREQLARNIALRNQQLSQRELNHAVQQTIDRIIFLRIAEDRGIENYGRLMALQNGENVYKRMLEQFREADAKYNSGLFHFHHEKGRTGFPDELSPGLAIDDKALKPILKNLYYPDSPYEFSVLPADILGQTYEQFLGKVIRLTPGHRAVVEDKPEVKKAGGVYYTPTYIVDYIVQHTVGKLLKGKTPRQVAKLTICDPACGSGSFLLGAYQYLLDWHLKWYSENDPDKWAKGRDPKIYQVLKGEWRLTTAEKKRILLNNIYGVDIDQQAVEVTKLSLLLKVLENETQDTLGRQMSMFHERALPDLAANIKCGNSLIAPDFYDQQDLGLMDEEERYRINVFDWQAEFPDIFTGKNPGFNAVIGNPPYIRIQAMKEWAPIEVEHYKRAYQSASKGNYDIYVVFVEKGLSLLNGKGRLGYILPSKFFTTDYGEAIRHTLANPPVVDAVVDFGHEQVFQNATTYTCLLFLDRSGTDFIRVLRTHPGKLQEASGLETATSSNVLKQGSWIFQSDTEQSLSKKLEEHSVPLLELPAAMSRGSSSGMDKIFCLQGKDGSFFTADGVHVEIEKTLLRQTIHATDFTRYDYRPKTNEWIIFPYDIGEDGAYLLEEYELADKYPKTYSYLLSKKAQLLTRKQFRAWYGFSAPRNLQIHDQADIIVPLLENRGLCTLLPKIGSHSCIMASAGFSISLKCVDSPVDPRYVLGLINSRLLFWRLKQISNKFRGGWITCTKQYFGTLPIHTIDFADASDKARHDRLVELVERMLSLHKQLAAARTGQDKTMTQRQIDATDHQIDRLVYELYGLTDEEIAIVEKEIY